jgi:hypothetical protein
MASFRPRVHAALAQIGIHLSPRTCGRILATNRALYGLEKPKGPVKEKREMPFAARRRHQFWSADVRYLKGLKLPGRFYVTSPSWTTTPGPSSRAPWSAPRT